MTAHASLQGLESLELPVLVYILQAEDLAWSSFSLNRISKRLSSVENGMAASIATSKATCHVRSISLPARLHPITLNVEVHLDRLRSSKATSTSNYHKLSGLKDLYECIDDLLQLSVTQRTLSNEQCGKSVDEVLDGSLRLLDVCGITRDIFSHMKESLEELQSSLRRRKSGESCLSNEVEAYMVSRKKLDKAISKCLRNLKSRKKSCTSTVLDKESIAVVVVGMLREVEEISLSVLESFLSQVSLAKARSRPGGWSVVSKLFQAKPVSAEREADTNEVEKMDAELLALMSRKDMNVVQVQYNERIGDIRIKHSQKGRGVGVCFQATTENQNDHSQHDQPLAVDLLMMSFQIKFCRCI